ncbi:AMP-dependent synthetase/ligase [Dermacoccaceae bacterium W4C1]
MSVTTEKVAGYPTATGPALEVTEEHNLARLAWRRVERNPQSTAFEVFAEDAWQPVSSTAHLDNLLGLARGLIAAGVQAGDRVALMSETRYEWLLIDSAVWACGGATVPIYPSSSVAQIEWIVADSGAKIVVVETQAHRALIEQANLGDVRVEVIEDSAVDVFAGEGKDIDPDQVRQRADAVTLSDVASVIYTSGTTGRPKGCVLTHGNLASEAQAVLGHPIAEGVHEGFRSLAFLPMAHVLARAVVYAAVDGNACVGFWSDFGSIVEKFGSFKPQLILGVPRVFEKIHDGIRTQAGAAGKVNAAVFARAEKVAIAYSKAQGGSGLGDAVRPGFALKARHALFDKLVYGKVRAAMGGQCGSAISGGGALSTELGHFFRGLGVPVYEGYGLTESCAAITVNGPGVQRIGTVGQPLAGNSVRIAPTGEIELRGGVVIQEYWQNEQATAEAFDDGWFRTGDLGELDDDGYLRITGRAKEIIVTSGGKNVVPGPIEDALRAHQLVGQAMVIGEGRKFVSALITLDPDGAPAWGQAHGLTGDLAALAADPAVREELQQAVEAACSEVSHAEAVKKFAILPVDFTEAAGEMTATLKMRRHIIAESHAQEINELYS